MRKNIPKNVVIAILTLIILGPILWFMQVVAFEEIMLRLAVKEIRSTPSLTNKNPEETRDLQNKLVYIDGKLESEKDIGDNLFIKPGNYIMLNRIVQTYAWVDTSAYSSSLDSPTMTWTATPKQIVGDKNNIISPITSKRFVTDELKIGNYYVSSNILTQKYVPYGGNNDYCPGNLILNNELIQNLPDNATVFSDFTDETGLIYIGNGNFGQPAIGDIRICYNAYSLGFLGSINGAKSSQEGILFGKLDNDTIVPYEKENMPILKYAKYVTNFANPDNKSIFFFRNFNSQTTTKDANSFLNVTISPYSGDMSDAGVFVFSILTIIVLIISTPIHYFSLSPGKKVFAFFPAGSMIINIFALPIVYRISSINIAQYFNYLILLVALLILVVVLFMDNNTNKEQIQTNQTGPLPPNPNNI